MKGSILGQINVSLLKGWLHFKVRSSINAQAVIWNTAKCMYSLGVALFQGVGIKGVI